MFNGAWCHSHHLHVSNCRHCFICPVQTILQCIETCPTSCISWMELSKLWVASLDTFDTRMSDSRAFLAASLPTCLSPFFNLQGGTWVFFYWRKGLSHPRYLRLSQEKFPWTLVKTWGTCRLPYTGQKNWGELYPWIALHRSHAFKHSRLHPSAVLMWVGLPKQYQQICWVLVAMTSSTCPSAN